MTGKKVVARASAVRHLRFKPPVSASCFSFSPSLQSAYIQALSSVMAGHRMHPFIGAHVHALVCAEAAMSARRATFSHKAPPPQWGKLLILIGKV